MPRRQTIIAVLAVAYTLFIALMTLGRQPIDDTRGSVLRTVLEWLAAHPATRWLDYSVVEFTGNIVLFVPFGLLIAAWVAPRRWWVALAAGVLYTVTIELIQQGLPGRVSDPRDLVANTLGTGIGVLLLVLLRSRQSSRSKRE